jgi:hypothetical protein
MRRLRLELRTVMGTSFSSSDDERASRLTGERTGRGAIERQALARTRLEIASMPASDVVQLALWPDNIAQWARTAGVSASVVYNMLARVKPYRRVRELLAHRLDVPAFVLDHLVDAARPLPVAMRPPDPDRPAREQVSHRGDEEPRSLALALPGVRDGSNPLERRALLRVEREIAALPASLVVQLALYPETLAQWARRQELPAPVLYATLAAAQPNLRIRYALSRRLGVAQREVDALIDARRAEPQANVPPMLADVAPAPAEPSAEPPPRASSPDGRSSASGDPPGQFSLGI